MGQDCKGRDLGAIAHPMRIALWKADKITFGKVKPWRTRHFQPAAPLDDDMKNNELVAACPEQSTDGTSGRRIPGPWCRIFAAQQSRTGDPEGIEHLRERIRRCHVRQRPQIWPVGTVIRTYGHGSCHPSVVESVACAALAQYERRIG